MIRKSSCRFTGRATSMTVALMCLFALSATAVRAASVTVDCDGGAADFATIQAAVNSLTPSDFNTITVGGTCTESVSISSFDNLAVQAVAGGASVLATSTSVFDIFDSPSVRLSGLTMDAGGGEYGVFAFESAVSITGSSVTGASDTGVVALLEAEVNLGGINPGDGVTIHDNLFGAFASRGELNLRGQVTIEDNTEDALIYSVSEGTHIGRDLGNTIRNNGAGVTVLDGGQVRFSGLHTIENNGPYGLFAQRPDRVVFSAYPGSSSGPPFYGTAIRNHAVWGVIVVSTRLDFFGPDEQLIHSVNNNGAAPYAKDAGVWVGRQAEARLRNMTIDDNYGHGVHGTLGAYVNLLNTSINNNDRHGVRLSWNTTGDLGSFSILDGTQVGPNMTITGNGKKAIKCAKTSVLAGDRSGISPIACDDISGFGADMPGLSGGLEEPDEASGGFGPALDMDERVLDRSRAIEAYAEMQRASGGSR